MTDFLTHGRILGGVVTTPDLDLALGDYRDRLGLVTIDRCVLSADLAASWGSPASAGARSCTLAPDGGSPCFLRLVEQDCPATYRATRSFGWTAFEIAVQDVFGWPNRLVGSGFDIVGPPREVPGLPYFVAMQMIGRGQEVLYLNEVRADTPDSDLPRPRAPVDQMFIAVLGAPHRVEAMDWYRRHLGLADGGAYAFPYAMINRAFGLPADTVTGVSLAQRGRLPVVEIDDYPPGACPREVKVGLLPPGNALVSIAVDSLDGCEIDFIAPPVGRDGPCYDGRRVATARGKVGELVELVEIGDL